MTPKADIRVGSPELPLPVQNQPGASTTAPTTTPAAPLSTPKPTVNVAPVDPTVPLSPAPMPSAPAKSSDTASGMVDVFNKPGTAPLPAQPTFVQPNPAAASPAPATPERKPLTFVQPGSETGNQ